MNAIKSHTPGPWQTSGTTIFVQRNPGGRKIYIADVARDLGPQSALANAKLIAAAPTLLDAVQAALADLEELGASTSQVSGVLPQLRAAIALAQGSHQNCQEERKTLIIQRDKAIAALQALCDSFIVKTPVNILDQESPSQHSVLVKAREILDELAGNLRAENAWERLRQITTKDEKGPL